MSESGKNLVDKFFDQTKDYLNVVVIFCNAVVGIAVVLNYVSGNRFLFYLVIFSLYLLSTSILLLIVRRKSTYSIVLPRPIEKPIYPVRAFAKAALISTLALGFIAIAWNLWLDYSIGLGGLISTCSATTPWEFSRTLLSTEVEDSKQIETLIRTEANASIGRDIHRVLSIFAPEAIIRDASGWPSEWKGCEQIQDRYRRLLDKWQFIKIQHQIMDLNIEENQAIANTQLDAEYIDVFMEMYGKMLTESHGIKTDPNEHFPIHVKTDEVWIFSKMNGRWRVTSFIYGISR